MGVSIADIRLSVVLVCTQGNGKLIFQGCISYLACILITYLGFAMMRFSNIERKYMRKLDGAARTVSTHHRTAS